MPQIRLTSHVLGPPLLVESPVGSAFPIPRLQFRCWARLPGTLLPRDGIIDHGSPLSWFPEAVWNRFQPGIDFEWLPFTAGYQPPHAQTAGWTFTFRMARLLQPISLFDVSTELVRTSVIVQFADGDPPLPPGSKRPPRVVFGLWGGVLEGTNLRTSIDAATGHVRGVLEW